MWGKNSCPTPSNVVWVEVWVLGEVVVERSRDVECVLICRECHKILGLIVGRRDNIQVFVLN